MHMSLTILNNIDIFVNDSKIAQWWSIRLLTEGLGVRVPLFEQNLAFMRGFLVFKQHFIFG
jgi:hypothetical protein